MVNFQEDNSTGVSPAGTIHIVDPSPLNWLFILFNTMEEAVRADQEGRVIPSLASYTKWNDDRTLEVGLQRGVVYHDGEVFTAKNVLENFSQVQLWNAPHPPGTWLNFHKDTELEMVDEYTVRFHFPSPDGLALGKMRANHLANSLFWQELGFGYAKLGTGEGHW